MDNQEQLKSRWELLRQGRIVLLIGALVSTFFGSFSPGGLVGQIGVVCLLLVVPVGLWERSTRKQAGVEPVKRPSLRSAMEEKEQKSDQV